VTSADTDKNRPNSASAGPDEPTAEDLAAIEFAEEAEIENVSDVELLRAEAALNLDRYQRAVADMANYRRRKEQETMRLGKQTRRIVLQQFLPILDDFERALAAVDAEAAGREWIDGFRLIERKLWAVLESEGVRPMDAIGEPFDPSFHDAVEVEDGITNADTVVGEHRRGYFIGDEVLRPAMVKVGRGDRGEDESS
jgi:molecular chaperone GrpE